MITPAVRYKLVEYASRITGSVDSAEAIFQDTVSHVLQKADLTRIKTFVPYLKICLRYNAFDWVKHERAKWKYVETAPHRTARSAFAEAISREAMQFFDKAVKKLSARERKVILMRVIDRLCYREIAKKMKTTELAARAAFWRAKARLRGFFEYMDVV